MNIHYFNSPIHKYKATDETKNIFDILLRCKRIDTPSQSIGLWISVFGSKARNHNGTSGFSVGDLIRIYKTTILMPSLKRIRIAFVSTEIVFVWLTYVIVTADTSYNFWKLWKTVVLEKNDILQRKIIIFFRTWLLSRKC